MVNVSWHPSRARCAVSVGRRVFLVDGVTGATLSCVRLPSRTSPSRTPPRARRRARGPPPRRQRPRRGPRRIPPVPPTPPRPHRQRQEARPRAARPTRPSRVQRRPVAPVGRLRPPGRRHTPRRVPPRPRRGPRRPRRRRVLGRPREPHQRKRRKFLRRRAGRRGPARAPPRQPRRPSRVAWASSGFARTQRSSPASPPRRTQKTHRVRRRAPSEPIVVAAYVDGGIRAYDLKTQTAVAALDRPSTPAASKTARREETPTCAAVLDGDDGCVVVVGDVAGRLRAWRADAFVSGADAAFGGAAAAFGGPIEPDDRVANAKAPVARVECAWETVASAGGAPVFTVSPLPGGEGVVALVGERRGTRDKRAISAPATFRVTASRGFGTDDGDGTVARQNQNSSWGFPPLPPAAHRAHIASHPTQPRAAAVAVGVADGANGVESTPGDASNEPTTVLAPSPPFTVFLASADSGASTGRRLCELTCPDHVPTASVAAPTPPPRPRHAWFLGGDAMWRVDLAVGPACARDVSSSRRHRPPRARRRAARRARDCARCRADATPSSSRDRRRRITRGRSRVRTRPRPGGSRSS